MKKVKYRFIKGETEALQAILLSPDHVITAKDGCMFLVRVQPTEIVDLYEDAEEKKFILLGNLNASVKHPPLEGTARMLQNLSTLDFLIKYRGGDDPATFLHANRGGGTIGQN